MAKLNTGLLYLLMMEVELQSLSLRDFVWILPKGMLSFYFRIITKKNLNPLELMFTLFPVEKIFNFNKDHNVLNSFNFI